MQVYYAIRGGKRFKLECVGGVVNYCEFIEAPHVQGMAIDEALAMLRAAGFAVERVRWTT